MKTIIHNLYDLITRTNKRRIILLALSCIVVFIITYMLILPAFTLEKDEAESQGGIDIPAASESISAEEDGQDSETDLRDGAGADSSSDADEETVTENDPGEATESGEENAPDESADDDTGSKAGASDEAGTGSETDAAEETGTERGSDAEEETGAEGASDAEEETGTELGSDVAEDPAGNSDSAGDKETGQTDGSAQETSSGGTEPEDGTAAGDPGAVTDTENSDVSGGNDAGADDIAETGDDTDDKNYSAGSLEAGISRRNSLGYKVIVTYGRDACVPEGSVLDVQEISKKTRGNSEYDNYLAMTGDTLGLEPDDISYVRLFDIKILDADGNKVTIAAPVDVKIELADKEIEEASDQSIRIVHFADGADKGDEIDALEITGDSVSFEAEGFSAYAIVEGPEPAPVGWLTVSSVEELIAMGSQGVYIGHPKGYYYGNTLKGNSTRMGIIKTKPAEVSPGNNAALYYFEKVEGTTNQVYAYCYAADGTTKQYVYNGNNNSLSFTDEAGRTAFTLTMKSDGVFTLNNGAWYWNMQGGESGERFCSYNNSGDINNEVNFWYRVSIDSDPYDLDGLTYGLMNWNGGVAGKAVMASEEDGALEAMSLPVMSTSNNSSQLFVPNDSDISMWTFHWAEDDKYHISVVADGSTKYLKIDGTELSLVSAREDASLIQVIPGTGNNAGEICLKSGGSTLTYSGKLADGFTVNGDVGNEWLHLVELSELTTDYFLTYSAEKVGVSDESITNGSNVIVYTRSWNKEKLKYDYYAISYDGSLVPVYENGDSIEWVSGQINTLLWSFEEHYWEGTTDPNYYYDLYNQYSGKYIAPQLTGDQVLSDDPIGINLNGRREGKYYSPVLAWDDGSYSYVGLKVEDGHIVPCPQSEGMDIYFAVTQDMNVDDQMTPVDTINNDLYGISMKIVDFDTRLEMSNYLGNNDGGVGTTLHQGLLSTDLTGGYPVTHGGSLSSMFAGAQAVNHLFLKSTYEESGYFEYDSSQNFATLKGKKGGDFTVYKELGTYDTGGNKPSLKHGQFFPFNDLKPGTFAGQNGQNLYTATGQLLPDGDARKYEQLYTIEYDGKKANTFFGVELEASFTQTPSGLDAWKHDIIFEFTGDDDFWLYVDDELVIDLGGIHSAVPGSVNFRTGVVNVNGTQTTLRDLFYQNYVNRGHTAAEAQTYVDGIFKQNDDGQWVFKDNTTHTMNIFYFERGAGASNLHMRFNLAAVKKGTVQLTKTLSGVDESNVLAEFPYQIFYKTEDGNEYRLPDKPEESSGENPDPGENSESDENHDYVVYKETVNPVKYEESITIDGKTYEDVFFLKPGETADISFPKGMTEYRIVECGVDTKVYSSVKANGTPIEVPGSETRKDFGIDYATTDARNKVTYDNVVNPDAIRRMTIKKKLYKEDGETELIYPEDETTFTFRLYMATEFDDLEAADMHIYHVKDPDGNYCKWDSGQKKLVKIGDGIADFSALTDEQKESASFTTSIYGTISNIPAGFTIEIRDVLAGTRYHLEERPAEIPDGYTFQKYDGYDTENASVKERGDSGIKGVNGTVVSGKDATMEVCNLKGWGLRVNKIWHDEDYMSSREATYYALFTGESEDTLVMVPNSLRQIPYSADPQTMYWYYDHLPVPGTSGVQDYLIREVAISANEPTIGEGGVVSDAGEVTPIKDGKTITLSGTQKGEETASNFVYTVSYETGQISEESNVRVDTVTNDRPGIVLKKQNWNKEPLEGATFTVTDNKGNLLGTFTSDEDGLITTAFLSNDKPYTLTETSAPQGYHGLETDMTIIDNNGTISVSGPGAEYYSVTQAQGTDPATLIIKDRPYTFSAVKTDGTAEVKLAGVEFALHRQVTVGDVTTIDLNPMPGYEKLVTGPDGIIPKLDNTLPAGTYELREKKPLDDYEPLSGYIRFTVSETGAITLGEHPADVTLSGEPDADGTMEYVLTIPNVQLKKVSFKKVDISDLTDCLPGAEFDLYIVKSEGETEERLIPPMYSGLTSGEDGLLRDSSGSTVFELPVGKYHLVETVPPEGYTLKADAVVVTVAADDVNYDEKTSVSGDGRGKSYNSDTQVYTFLITNSTGVELPHTGGPGNIRLYFLGAMMILASCIGMTVSRRRRERSGGE